MRRGIWHQLGDKNQIMAQEQLDAGNGVGVIISPRDLTLDNAAEYAAGYRGRGASVLWDPQFYLPEFSNDNLDTYPTSDLRVSVSDLAKFDAAELTKLRDSLRTVSETLHVDAILAPAVVYQAGRDDVLRLNERLLGIARDVGAALGKPTYATAVFGRSATSSDQTLDPLLDNVTGLQSDGWYFGFEFEPERVPSDAATVKRCCTAILSLACTGRPVLHAFSGPMAPLALGSGATGVGVGHTQNLWRFSPERWQESEGGGGGGGAPARFFSRALWGTVVHPDELEELPPALKARVITPSAFSGPVTANPPQPWSKWEAYKHMIAIIGTEIVRLIGSGPAKAVAKEVVELLKAAVALHAAIRKEASWMILKDGTSLYQDPWRVVMEDVLRDNEGDYNYLQLL